MICQDVDVICACPDEWRRLRLSRVCELAGFHVRTCATTRELLQLVAIGKGSRDASRVLLLDLQLTDGLSASQIVSALRRAVVPMRTVILAGRDDEAEVIKCLREGADDFIHYPADPSEVIEVVTRVSVLPDIR